MASDSSSEGLALGPSKLSKLTIEQKRELVYEISERPNDASEVLQSWSRQDILQILCAEMGKERKYTGMTKLKMVENLLRIVSEKKSGVLEVTVKTEPQSSPSSGDRTIKRLKKTDHSSLLQVLMSNFSVNNAGTNSGSTVYCKNSACRATLSWSDKFCRRCSCCICHKYDDNKDPSLWLICSPEPPFEGDSCGMSCHLECALNDESSGIGQGEKPKRVEGSFCCVSCGKPNDLLGCWRKQLMQAKDTRKVDVLCYRISLCQKLLNGTKKYKNIHDIVDEAMKNLESEVGPFSGFSFKMGRGIVNRLSSGPEVQKLCAFAIESLDSVISEKLSLHIPDPILKDLEPIVQDIIGFEDVQATSLTVVFLYKETASDQKIIRGTLWHRKASDTEYPDEPTCTLFASNARFVVRGLVPSTPYLFKTVLLDGSRELGMFQVESSTGSSDEEAERSRSQSQSPATNSSDLSNSNPSSVEDETYTPAPPYCDNMGIEVKNTDGKGAIDALKHSEEDMNNTDNGSDDNSLVQTGMECVPFINGSSSQAVLPITPCKLEVVVAKDDGLDNGGTQKGGGGPHDGSTSKKKKRRKGEEDDDDDNECGPANGISSDGDLEYYVKTIRWLECEGHIDRNFRQQFLTWYSLRATPQEVRIVKVFVDTLMEDPTSLAEQLIDTFSDCILTVRKRSHSSSGLCMKLWH